MHLRRHETYTSLVGDAPRGWRQTLSTPSSEHLYVHYHCYPCACPACREATAALLPSRGQGGHTAARWEAETHIASCAGYAELRFLFVPRRVADCVFVYMRLFTEWKLRCSASGRIMRSLQVQLQGPLYISDNAAAMYVAIVGQLMLYPY